VDKIKLLDLLAGLAIAGTIVNGFFTRQIYKAQVETLEMLVEHLEIHYQDQVDNMFHFLTEELDDEVDDELEPDD
jgi:hypothetical protein